MKLSKIFSTKRIFIRLLLQFVAFLLLPIIFASSLYLSSAKQASESCIDSSLISLRHVKNEFDNYVNALDQVATQLMFEPQLNKISVTPRPVYGSRQVYFIKQFCESLKARMNSSTHIDTSFILLLKDVSAAYYNEYVVFDLEFFYDKFLNYSGYSSREWFDIIFQNKQPFFLPQNQICYNGVNMSSLTYVFPITAGYTGKKTVLFFIRKEKLEEFCRGTDSNLNRNIYISNSNGELLYSKVNPNIQYNSLNIISETGGNRNEGFYFDTADNEKYMVVYTRSQFKDIIFTEVIPQSVAMDKVIYIRQMTCYMVIAYLIIAIISAVSFARRNSKPVSDLVNKLTPFLHKLGTASTHTDELDCIKTGVDYLRNTVQHTYNELKDIFLDRLFNGSFNNIEDMKQAGERLNLNVNGSYYCAAVLELSFSESENDGKREDVVRFIYSQLVQSLPDFVFGTRLRNFQIILLFILQTVNEQPINYIMNFLSETGAAISRYGKIGAAAGIGRVVTTLWDVQYSYEQAHFVLKNAEKNNNEIIQYDDLPGANLENIFYYPIEMEYKLFNCTKAGERENVLSILDTIYEENINKRRLTRRVGTLLMENLKSTLLKICADSSIGSEYSKKIRELNVNMPQPVVLENITNTFLELCDIYVSNKANQKLILSKRIIRFVQEHYNDPMMGVPMVAAEFNFSESYFSQFFKEYTDQNFSTYLEKYRIDKAKELICENKYDLEKISGMVGYNSSNTFRRAFKRLEGISPSVYKESILHKKIAEKVI